MFYVFRLCLFKPMTLVIILNRQKNWNPDRKHRLFPKEPHSRIKLYLGFAGEESDEGRGQLLAQVGHKVRVLPHHLHVFHQNLNNRTFF